MTRETGASALTVARRRDVNARRARVAQALDAMRTEGIEITISSVAVRAGVHMFLAMSKSPWPFGG